MSGNAKLALASVLATVLIVIGAVFFLSGKPQSDNQAPEPIDQSVLVRDEGYNVLGEASASVTLVEFSDFECPFCASAAPILKQVVEKYPGQVRLIYRHFPLIQIHDQALPAAYAVEAAGLQGKFWQMHDAVFAKQKELSKQTLKQIAEEIGLDVEQWEADMGSDTVKKRVEQDQVAAAQLKLTGTPSLFINGTKYPQSLPITIDNLSSQIDLILQIQQLPESSPAADSSASPQATE